VKLSPGPLLGFKYSILSEQEPPPPPPPRPPFGLKNNYPPGPGPPPPPSRWVTQTLASIPGPYARLLSLAV